MVNHPIQPGKDSLRRTQHTERRIPHPVIDTQRKEPHPSTELKPDEVHAKRSERNNKEIKVIRIRLK
jgi:hypothetical protein